MTSTLSNLAGGIAEHNVQAQINTLSEQINTMQQQISHMNQVQLQGGAQDSQNNQLRQIQQQIARLQNQQALPSGRAFQTGDNYFVKEADGNPLQFTGSAEEKAAALANFFRTGQINGEAPIPRHIVPRAPEGHVTKRIEYKNGKQMEKLFNRMPCHLLIVQRENEHGDLEDHLVMADVPLMQHLDQRAVAMSMEQAARNYAQEINKAAREQGEAYAKKMQDLVGDIDALTV